MRPPLNMNESSRRTTPINDNDRRPILGAAQCHFVEMMKSNRDPLVEKTAHPLATLEVAKHNRADDCWIIFKGKVYDITRYLDVHPGGRHNLLESAGMDLTEQFLDIHPWVNAEFLLQPLFIGEIKEESVAAEAHSNMDVNFPAS